MADTLLPHSSEPTSFPVVTTTTNHDDLLPADTVGTSTPPPLDPHLPPVTRHHHDVPLVPLSPGTNALTALKDDLEGSGQNAGSDAVLSGRSVILLPVTESNTDEPLYAAAPNGAEPRAKSPMMWVNEGQQPPHHHHQSHHFTSDDSAVEDSLNRTAQSLKKKRRKNLKEELEHLEPNSVSYVYERHKLRLEREAMAEERKKDEAHIRTRLLRLPPASTPPPISTFHPVPGRASGLSRSVSPQTGLSMSYSAGGSKVNPQHHGGGPNSNAASAVGGRRVLSPIGTAASTQPRSATAMSSLVGTQQSSSLPLLGQLPDEDRDAIRLKLMPKTVVSEDFDSAFTHRLKSINSRNSKESLVHAQNTKHQLLVDELKRGEQRILEQEQRMKEIEEAQKSFQTARKLEMEREFISKWLLIVKTVTWSIQTMKGLLIHKSLEVFRRSLLPMLLRKCAMFQRLKERKQLTQSRLADIPVVSPAMIRTMTGSFFQGWTDTELQTLCSSAYPKSYRVNEYIMFEGDYDRVMYFIVKGSVQIQIRNRKIPDKRRSADTAAAKFVLKAPCYVGEFALLCKEPRSASIQCTEDVDVWIVSSEKFHEVVKTLSAEVRQRQQEATDERRRGNLKKFFTLRPEMIRKINIFAHWDYNVLKEMTTMLEPMVQRTGDRLFREGDYEPSMFFIADGTVKLTKPTEPNEPPVLLGAGDCFGAFETFFMKERRSHTVTCTSNCDIWRLSRKSLLDLGMNDPNALMQSKIALQQLRAKDMFKDSKAPMYVLKDPYLQFALPSAQIHLLWELAKPKVFGAGEDLAIEGDECQHIFFVTLGAVQVKHVNKEFHRFDDKFVVSPVMRGVYSGLNYTNDNLKKHFPSVQYCEIPKDNGKLRPRRSIRAASITALLSGTMMNGTTTDPLAASMLREAEQEGAVGVPLGTFEFASRQNRWGCSYSCATMCEVFVVEKSAIEQKLPEALLRLLTNSPQSARVVIDAYHARKAESLSAEPPSVRISGQYLAMKQQEKEQEQNAKKGSGKGGKKL